MESRLADDYQLWERIRQGDAQAFDSFYRANAPRLEAFLRHVVGNRQAAEDLMQDTFTQIWRRPNGFQPERGTLRAYLYGIGRRRAAEWWRTQGNRGATLEDDPAPSRTETISAVNEAFRQLPEEQRILLWLREVEGHSYVELAETLEVPVGTVRSRLFAAREALRGIWQSPRQRLKESS
jgi:RNA polymerase sigma-70 factor (ECF subfamily)